MLSTSLSPIFSALFLTMSCLLTQYCTAAEPVVTETVDDDKSVIHIKASEGGEKVYRIDLSTHHSPASEKSAILKKWESYRLGAFVCFNTNQFTGEELCKNP